MEKNNINVGTNSPTYTSSTLTSGNTLKCVITSSSSCAAGNPATSNTITASVLPVPATPTISQSGSVLTSSASSGNQWYKTSSGAIAGQTGVNYTITGTGTFFTLVTGSNGCPSDSSNFITIVGIEEYESLSFNVYPNPNNGVFTIVSNSESKEYTIELINVLGALIYQKKSTEKSFQLDGSNLESGIYFLRISTDKSSGTQKIIVKK